MLVEDAKKIEATLKLSEETKAEIDSLSKAELIQEINKKNRSRFQGDKYAYLETRLVLLEQDENESQRQLDLAHRAEELSLAREANEISRGANKLSKVAIFFSVVAIIVSIVAILSEILIGGGGNAP